MYANARSLAKRLADNTSGNIVVETALVMPVVLGIVFGTVDIVRYLQVRDDMVKAVATSADVAARKRSLAEADLSAFLQAAANTIDPAANNASARIIVSGVARHGDASPLVKWQRTMTPGGSIPDCSKIGQEDSVATLPNGFQQASGTTFIAAEACYTFQPTFFLSDAFFSAGVVPQDLYEVAIYETRYSPLTSVTPGAGS